MAAALANPTRLRALKRLFQGEKSLGTLAAELGESEANAAAHLKSLRAAGLVSARKQGKHVFLDAREAEVLRVPG
ncbi:ArsR/SmtB family transcription factor [Haliangium ochraceum]|uniref:ArsR/SmtB family transcription factor n=1 Tax=Haliangium ochraceum TaxID=80816 RepID=UPI003B838F90